MTRRITGLSQAQEWQAQTRMRRTVERAYAPAIRVEIRRAWEGMAAQYALTGSLPALPIDHERRMMDIYRGIGQQTVTAAGNRILGQGKAVGEPIETKDFAAFFERLADEWINAEAVRARIASIAETTRDQMIRLISMGQTEGEGVDAIARRLSRAIPSLSRDRAAVIARTETHGAANFGADGAARATGLRLRKEWISIADTRVRDFNEPIAEFSHRRMNGETVPMDGLFAVPKRGGGVEMLAYPGAVGGSAANVINCRCATGHIVEDI